MPFLQQVKSEYQIIIDQRPEIKNSGLMLDKDNSIQFGPERYHGATVLICLQTKG